MKSSELLKKIEEIRNIQQHLMDNLDQVEKDFIDSKYINMAIENMEVLLRKKNVSLESTNDVLSSKITDENMTLDDWIKFYQNNVFMEQERNTLIAKLHSLTNFTFPILELFPGLGKLSEGALAAEPFYIADYRDELLDAAGSVFNPIYASRRLVKCKISDFDLGELPLDQIGVVFSFNMFYSKNSQFVASWARECHKVIRPGGYFLFNFIPSTTSWGMELTEQYRLTALDPGQLKDMIESVGYDQISVDLQPNYASTMLFKKHGELTTFKLTSILPKIIDKSTPFV